MRNIDHHHKKCSIVNIHGHIVIIDHRHDDHVIEPACGLDALAHYNYLMNSPKHGVVLGQEFLVQIANGETPCSRMIQNAGSQPRQKAA